MSVTTLRVATIKKKENKLVRMWGNWNSHALFMGM